MRLPSTFFDSSFNFSFLRTTPARKPRTECCCQPVCLHHRGNRCSGRRSQHRDHASLLGGRIALLAGGGMTTAGCEGFVVVARAGLDLGERLFADFLTGFGIGISIRLIAAFRRTTEAPPRPTSRRGAIPRPVSARTAVLPLQSPKNASPFWIMLLLNLGTNEHGIISWTTLRRAAPPSGKHPQPLPASAPPNSLSPRLRVFSTGTENPCVGG